MAKKSRFLAKQPNRKQALIIGRPLQPNKKNARLVI
jgi:hypothetical protein